MADQPVEKKTGKSRPRVGLWISLAVLAAFALVLGVLFYQMVRPLAVPLFFGAVVAMLLEPVHSRVSLRLGGRSWLSATLVTAGSLVAVVVPLALFLYFGFDRLHGFVTTLASTSGKAVGAAGASESDKGRLEPLILKVSETLNVDPGEVRTTLAESVSDLEKALYTRSLKVLGSVPLIVLGLVLFALAVFFLLKDWNKIAKTWDELTPLGPVEDQAIRKEFGTIFRTVIWGTVAASFGQAVVFTAGFFVINAVFGLGWGAWTLVLALLTLVCAGIPFLGAVAVWGPTALALFLMGDRAAAVTLAVYGALVVSQIDTVIRVWVLRNSAKLHPFLALVCVFGGILYFGILGVFLGPMIGALLVAMLRILKKEVLDVSTRKGRQGPESPEVQPEQAPA